MFKNGFRPIVVLLSAIIFHKELKKKNPLLMLWNLLLMGLKASGEHFQLQGKN